MRNNVLLNTSDHFLCLCTAVEIQKKIRRLFFSFFLFCLFFLGGRWCLDRCIKFIMVVRTKMQTARTEWLKKTTSVSGQPINLIGKRSGTWKMTEWRPVLKNSPKKNWNGKISNVTVGLEDVKTLGDGWRPTIPRFMSWKKQTRFVL